ncbi:hypothetical protein [Nonomuraea sp. NPDC049784]|uniref:hypothetical protein n=1 Tax=Nonomuraea sp. NPDC049784 TaxID=3154361 RepID=UPI0033CEFFF1
MSRALTSRSQWNVRLLGGMFMSPASVVMVMGRSSVRSTSARTGPTSSDSSSESVRHSLPAAGTGYAIHTASGSSSPTISASLPASIGTSTSDRSPSSCTPAPAPSMTRPFSSRTRRSATEPSSTSTPPRTLATPTRATSRSRSGRALLHKRSAVAQTSVSAPAYPCSQRPGRSAAARQCAGTGPNACSRSLSRVSGDMSCKRSICSCTESSRTGARGTTLSGAREQPGAPSGRTASLDRRLAPTGPLFSTIGEGRDNGRRARP